jgi:hypothetical protein
LLVDMPDSTALVEPGCFVASHVSQVACGDYDATSAPECVDQLLSVVQR